MDVARDVIELFSVKDPARAREIANRLDQLNAERQEEERRILESITVAFRRGSGSARAFCIVIDGESWHRGVIGITATRVVERYGRPALVISREGSMPTVQDAPSLPSTCSMRWNHAPNCSTRYGGHSHAVGFSLPVARVAELRAHLDDYARARLTLRRLRAHAQFRCRNCA